MESEGLSSGSGSDDGSREMDVERRGVSAGLLVELPIFREAFWLVDRLRNCDL